MINNTMFFYLMEALKRLSLFIVLVKRLLLMTMVLLLTSCGTIHYYYQAINGQITILTQRENIESLTNDPGNDLTVLQREKLTIILSVRHFAEHVLQLPVGKAYTQYSDLGRSHVVWNVFAAPELDVASKKWCYPLIGCANYRGFFKQNSANRYARKLSDKGYEIYVGGVRAYSTLGWFNDPVLNTFLDLDDLQLAGLIFHELAHRVVYVKGDTEFNESFATAVEHFGVALWAKDNGYTRQTINRYHARLQQQLKFVDIVSDARNELMQLYLSDQSDVEKRKHKKNVFNRLDKDLTAYGKGLNAGHAIEYYSDWADDANNAKLLPLHTYFQWLRAIEWKLGQLLQKHNCNWNNQYLDGAIRSDSCQAAFSYFYKEIKRFKKYDAGLRKNKLEDWNARLEEGY